MTGARPSDSIADNVRGIGTEETPAAGEVMADGVRGIGTEVTPNVVEVIGTTATPHVGIRPNDAIAFPLLLMPAEGEVAALAGPWARREARAPTLATSRWISS